MAPSFTSLSVNQSTTSSASPPFLLLCILELSLRTDPYDISTRVLFLLFASLDLATEHSARIDLPSCGCPHCRLRSSRPLLGRRRHRMMPTSRVFRYAHLQQAQSWVHLANNAHSCERTRCNRFVATIEVHHVRIRSTILTTISMIQPYLDSDMTSRWFDFGGDTIIRTDSYV